MMDVLSSCFAIVGSLCVQGSANAEILYGPGWSGTVIREKNGVIISSMTGSDAEVTPYLPVMHRICAEKECILYRAGCINSGETTTCTIWYSYNATIPLRKIEMAGRLDDVHDAMRDLKLVRSHRSAIPLSRFQYDAIDALPPACFLRAGCKPR